MKNKKEIVIIEQCFYTFKYQINKYLNIGYLINNESLIQIPPVKKMLYTIPGYFSVILEK